tara:strand:- start:1033 stop:1236 length:204 start_codon:yes stop_codon:yes gene_type:complete
MKTSEKIEYAKKRIEELTLLISYWEEEENAKSLKGLKLTEKDYQLLKETTKEELEVYLNLANLNKIK